MKQYNSDIAVLKEYASKYDIDINISKYETPLSDIIFSIYHQGYDIHVKNKNMDKKHIAIIKKFKKKDLMDMVKDMQATLSQVYNDKKALILYNDIKNYLYI